MANPYDDDDDDFLPGVYPDDLLPVGAGPDPSVVAAALGPADLPALGLSVFASPCESASLCADVVDDRRGLVVVGGVILSNCR